MPTIHFTPHLTRHVDVASQAVEAATLREALERVFARTPALAGYVVDERFRLRRHVMVYIDNRPLVDRAGLADPLGPTSEIYVMQALSGG